MIIKSVRVKNFRSIKDETLLCDKLTALVGANGSGKSSFLRAIELFYSKTPKIEADDYYNGDTSEEIVIVLTFGELSEQAKKLFANYIQGDELTVERVFRWADSKHTSKFHGSTLQNPAFKEVRNAFETSAKAAKPKYDELRTQGEYSKFPSWSSINVARDTISKWELENPAKCIRQRDDGQFFGFNEVGQGYLGRFTRFLYIPAVRDASTDASEGRGSVLTELMDLVVRTNLAKKAEVQKFQKETRAKYKEIMDPTKLTELQTLADEMTKTLRSFVPDTKVDLTWQPLEELDIALPKAEVKLLEDEYQSTVARTGHGLQRAFIMTLLQHLSAAQTSETHIENDDGVQHPQTEHHLLDLVLVIEEPELYQHPNRQRHLAKILLKLAEGKTPGVSERTQVIYSTHSPHFVDIERTNQIRLLRKVSVNSKIPKVTKIFHTNLDDVANEIWEIDGKPASKYTGNTLLPRLYAIMTPWMSEGFFADVVILVEGEEDRAAILGTARAMEYELESMGFSIIPCYGKNNFDRPTVIFRKLGIPVFIIWDGDEGNDKANPKENHRLLRLVGEKPEDWPSKISDTFACFKKDLESTMREEIDDKFFQACISDCQQKFNILKREHAIKNPAVIATVIQKANEQGHPCNSLQSIIQKIVNLKK